MLTLQQLYIMRQVCLFGSSRLLKMLPYCKRGLFAEYLFQAALQALVLNVD